MLEPQTHASHALGREEFDVPENETAKSEPTTRGQNPAWIGFDLGGTKMLSVVYDDQFNELGRKRSKTFGHAGADVGMEKIGDTIAKAIAKVQEDDLTIAGIGVGCPGPLDLDRGVILHAPNLGWENVALKDALTERFECPVYVLNDVDAGVYGEYRFGAGKDARCLVGVFPGTGIGGGCVYQGEIIRGKSGSCFEIGHIRVAPDGPLCGCGRRGCLEAVASRLAIAASAAQAAYRGQAPYLLKTAGVDLAEIRSSVLAEAAAHGDAVVEQIIRQAAQHIGAALGSVVSLLAPDRVVLGGGLVEAMPELFVAEVEKSANKNTMDAFAGSFKVFAARLADDAGVMGAAAWARRRVQED